MPAGWERVHEDRFNASLDLQAGKLLGRPEHFPQGFVFDARHPSWSPDGKRLAYPVEDGSHITIRTVATGEVQLLPSTLNYVPAVTWSPDGRSLLVKGTDLKGRDGVFTVDARTGESKMVAETDHTGNGDFARCSPDGKTVYFNWDRMLVGLDLASGTERVLGPGLVGPLSPDGRYFAAVHGDRSNNATSLSILPVAGGQPRELLRVDLPEILGHLVRLVWTPASSAVLVVKYTGSRNELWQVPLSGGQPRKLDIDPDTWMEAAIAPGSADFSLSPDGRSIAFQTGKSTDEVWALENFLPATSH